MAQQLGQSVICILNSHGITVGTGFVVSNQLAVTCAHVVKAANSDCGQSVRIKFFADGNEQTAQVLTDSWSAPASDDVAFLQLKYLPQGIVPVVLSTAEGRSGHQYSALGFASIANYQARFAYDNLGGVVPLPYKYKGPMLQLMGDEIKAGMSGAPVLDTQSNRVVGMVSEYKDDERTRFAWATTADTLLALNPLLGLWPDAYGPKELNTYLDFLINANQTLILPDSSEVLLERVYVSLRADEMNTTERKAEHDLYLEDVALLKQLAKGAASDHYAEFTAMRKVIARHPKMLMLDARNWPRLFNKREQSLLSLAEVVRRHPHVVLLGDPGSGKTTLAKWLVLQFARALREGQSRVQVQANLVQPSAEANKLVDLGPARLPILIRIADYARTRWDKDRGDTKLPLERFLAFHQGPKYLPSTLNSDAVGALSQDYLSRGRALVILDGLDEVGDPDQRLEVMQAVKKLIYGQTLMPKVTETTSNRVILTSRIVGYQFQPLTDLPHYTVEDMDETAITAFCRAWMMHVAGVEEANQEAQKLKDAIFDHAHPGVRSLAGNPLLLTILAQVYWVNTEHALPTRRITLFDAATKAMYDQRKEFWDRVHIPSLRLTRALGAVAMHIQENERTGFVEEGTVREQLGTVLFDREQVEAVLEAAREVSGFLVARGEGVYGFLHRSLQEYFVAQHLVDNPAHAATNLAERVLDTGWREVITLAVALVSQRRYPNSRRHLTEVFDALLHAQDTTGDFLPRRELLAAVSCIECERVPPETGAVRQIVENLLGVYAKHVGSSKSVILSTRIQQTIMTLLTIELKDQVEATFCEVLQAPDSERRKAAITIISEIKWNSPALVYACIKAWFTYAGPVASLLAILDHMIRRNPQLFQLKFLPLRQAIANESSIWSKAMADQKWRAIISTLYLPLGAEFIPELINRDSPLTPQLLVALRRPPSAEPLKELPQILTSLVSQPHTAMSRDAVLALSIIGGDTSWMMPIVTNLDNQESQISPLIVSLTIALKTALASDISLAQIVASTRGHANTHDLVSTLTGKLEKILASIEPDGLESGIGGVNSLIDTLDLAHRRALDLALNRDQARSHSRLLADALERSRSRFKRLTNVLEQALTSELINDMAQSLNRAVTFAPFVIRGRRLAFNHSRAVAHNVEKAQSHQIAYNEACDEISHFANIIAQTVDSILVKVREARSVLGNVLPVSIDSVYRTRDLIHTYTHELESILEIHLESDPNYTLDLDNILARDLELVLAQDIELTITLVNTNVRASQIKRSLQTIRDAVHGNHHLVHALDKALIFFQSLQEIIVVSTNVAEVLNNFMIMCREQWPNKTRPLVDPIETNELITGTLVEVVEQLTSSNDVQRGRAQRILEAKHLASALGKPVIEQIAKLAYTDANNPVVNTHLRWTLQEIIHDTSSWINQWIEQVKTSQDKTPAEAILGAIHRIAPETFEAILDALPNSSLRVNGVLLESLSWLTRLERIPKGTLPMTRKQLLAWLYHETDPNIRCLIIDVLGHWREDSDVVGIELLNYLNHSMPEAEHAALYKALAQLATHRSHLVKAVRIALRAAYKQPGAAVALVRLSLSGTKQKSMKPHSVLAKSDKFDYLIALLDAGTDDDIWNDNYHGVLIDAIRAHLETHADLLPVLLARLHQALEEQNWPAHRIVLAAVAACTEVMPIAVQRAYLGKLESLLVKGTTDAESFNSRRFAFTALSYLRTVTPAIVPALLTGCEDTEAVQRDTIAAASRFQSIVGNPLPLLIPWLTGESVSTAYVIAQLLGALGLSVAGEAPSLREQIIEALVDALKDPGSQREVVISGESKGKLEDVLYIALLQAAGWTE